MAVRRGALRAFHHQIGYAVRRLRHGCPVMAGELLPTVHELQKKIVQISPRVADGGCEVKWPPWRQNKLKQLRQQHQPQQEVECNFLGAEADDNIVTKRALQQHDTDETCFTEGGGDIISDTETWADGASLLDVLSAASQRHHSRRPRTSRRARSRAHQQEFVEQVALAARGSDAANVATWSQSMVALLECLEEDAGIDHDYHDHHYHRPFPHPTLTFYHLQDVD